MDLASASLPPRVPLRKISLNHGGPLSRGTLGPRKPWLDNFAKGKAMVNGGTAAAGGEGPLPDPSPQPDGNVAEGSLTTTLRGQHPAQRARVPLLALANFDSGGPAIAHEIMCRLCWTNIISRLRLNIYMALYLTLDPTSTGF